MYPMVLTGLLDLFRSASDLEVIPCAPDGHDTIARIRSLDPDLLIVSQRLNDHSALDVLRRVHREQLRARIILLSSGLTDAEAVTALRLGVRGILQLEMSSDEILSCVRSVHAGRTWLEPHLSRRTLERLLRQDAATAQYAQVLTTQELVVARLVVQGLPNKLIAANLGIAEGTVKAHLHNVYRKLDVENRVALVLHAREHGLSDGDALSPKPLT